MKKILPFSLIIIAALILAACGGGASPMQVEATAPPDAFYDMLPSSGGAPAQPASARVADQATANTDSGVAASAVERVVIKNADLSIVVADVEGRMKNIQTMAEQRGGYVVSSNLY